MRFFPRFTDSWDPKVGIVWIYQTVSRRLIPGNSLIQCQRCLWAYPPEAAVASIYQLAYTMGCLYIVAGPAILATPDAVLDALSEKNGGAAQVFKTLLLVLVGLGLLEWRRPGSLRGVAEQISRWVSKQDPNYGMPPRPTWDPRTSLSRLR